MFMSKGEDWKSRALAAENRLANAAVALETAIKEADRWFDEACGDGRVDSKEMDGAREVLRSLLPNSPQGSSSNELDVTKTAINQASQRLARDLDALVSEGITRALGGAEWMLADVANRCTRTRVQGDDIETWCLDGVPFLEVQDVPPSIDDKFIAKMQFNYRFLFNEVQHAG
ncbi:MAG: hypothetical protein Q7U48_13800 [Hydrogenophaga sp.]|nr:hypothetical protein [Hydrogenophaga sp.]